MSEPISRMRTLWRRHWLLLLYGLLAILVAVQRVTLHKHNVYLIFRASFFNLLHGLNLYAAHPGQHADFFRYSPTFAVLFAPLAVLPVGLGVALWCLINFLALYAAIARLLPGRAARLVQILVLGDLIRSMQSSQSNALIAALMIAAFLAYEGEHPWRGAWAVTAGAFIKIFPGGAALFALLRPRPVRAVGALALAGLVLVLLPLPLTGPHLLLQEYRWWAANERGEVVKAMYSVMDLLDVWTGRYWPRLPVQVAGLLVTLLPVVVRRDAWDAYDFRRRLLCSVLCFVVLFNHGAETPSYVISTAGIAIWYATGPRDTIHGVLMILTLLLVTVAVSDLVPDLWRDRLINPARLKVVPVLAAWIWMQVELWRFGRGSGRPEVRKDEVAAAQAPA